MADGMTLTSRLDAVDLFSGMGGFSEGARQAGCRVLWSGNHWEPAVQWHAANHPDTIHACQDLHQQRWEEVPPHDLLLASWACQGFSPAKGSNKLHTDTQRATAWAVVSAVEYHRPPVFIGENVPAFARWELYPVWCAAMERLGYALAPMVVDCADLGVPQQRVRLFIVGTRSQHPIQLALPKREHVPAANIIDFNAGKWSPIHRPGRAAATLARIENGRRQHGDRFVQAFYGATKGGRSLSRPLGTITTRDRWAVIDGDRMRMLMVPEARRAMTVPATYKLPDNGRLAMHLMGNAVPPLAAKEVITAVRKAA